MNFRIFIRNLLFLLFQEIDLPSVKFMDPCFLKSSCNLFNSSNSSIDFSMMFAKLISPKPNVKYSNGTGSKPDFYELNVRNLFRNDEHQLLDERKRFET